MRIIFFVVFFLSSYKIVAQDVLFKVISSSEGVTIDGMPATPGTDVVGKEKAIFIPSEGYMGVIANNGELIKITQSTSAGNLPPKVKKLPATGAVMRGAPDFDLFGVGDNQQSLLLNDSIFFTWKKWQKWQSIPEDTVTVHFVDMFDQPIEKTSVVKNNYGVLRVDENRLAKEGAILFYLTCRLKLLPPKEPLPSKKKKSFSPKQELLRATFDNAWKTGTDRQNKIRSRKTSSKRRSPVSRISTLPLRRCYFRQHLVPV